MSIKGDYEKMTSEREGFLDQARKQSELTLPYLMPPSGTNETYQDLYKPYQSLGAMGVTYMANKLTGALFPANEPFFMLQPITDSEELAQVPDEQLASIDAELSNMEQRIMSEIFKRGDRADITEAIKHLLVTGNACLYIGEDKSSVYALDSYVAERDGNGNLLRVITKDCLNYETFKMSNPDLHSIHAKHKGNRNYEPKTIEVYTEMCLKDGRWYVQEECEGEVIPGSKANYPLDKPPYLALRFIHLSKQSYGRGYVETVFGDLSSLESLCQAMVEGSAINARVIFLVNPNGFTSASKFEKAVNGAVLPGTAADVTTAKVDKGTDLAVTANEVQRIEARLTKAFMLSASQQRDAERVTATEVREVVAEVEEVLGDTYSVLSEDFQRPYINRILTVLQTGRKIPEIPEGAIDVAIVTGVSSIGRGVDKQRMLEFLQVLAQSLGAEALQQYVNIPAAIAKLAASFGINVKEIIKSAEQMAQEQQQAQQMQMTQQLGPAAIQAAGKMAEAPAEEQPPTEGEPI